jgi:hypothetical protein
VGADENSLRGELRLSSFDTVTGGDASERFL